MRKQRSAVVQVTLSFISLFIAVAPISAARQFAPLQLASVGAENALRPALLPPAKTDSAPGADQIQAELALDDMPLYFIANQGQADRRVSFYVQGRDKTIYFSPQGLTFALTAPLTPTSSTLPPGGEQTGLPVSPEETPGSHARQRWAVKLDFVGADPQVQPLGESPTQAVISYFKGQPSEWVSAAPTYAQIRYPNLWPGIDLIYSGRANQLKYEFVVQPGSDPDLIQLAYRGASDVRLVEGGQLEVSTPLGGFRDAAPLAYQDRDGQRLPVEMAYALAPSGNTGQKTYHRYGFDLGPYDPSLPLVLDPAVFIYTGYIGGSSFEEGNSIAVDIAGNAYVTGSTYSTDSGFPVAAGPDLTSNGDYDAFVAKVNAAGTALVYAGYIGGAGYDVGRGIGLDEAGNAYITGSTISTESSFPVLVGPDLTYNGNIQYGFGDAFVAKVNAAGTSLVYAGYIGGSKSDGGFDIAVDANGNAYIAGSTNSDETTFPLVVGPFLTFQPGVYSIPQHDAFVAKVNANGSSLLYAGYIGGEESDLGNGIALDEDGSVYVTGSTLSKYSFPTLVGPSLSIHGDVDAYVAKVNPAGTGLVYAGYIGGSADDVGSDIAVDGEGNAYITGGTFSTESTLLVVGGPDLTHNGNQDAFVVKVNSDGSGLVYAGYLGGASEDWGNNITVDNAANAYIVGYTDSDQSTFPELDGPDLTYNGGRDAFVAMVNPPGSGLVYAGYVGGTGSEEGRGIAVDSSGNAYFSGKTDSNELSFPEKGGPDLTFNGGTDVFVSKIGSANAGSTDLAVSRTEIIQGITMSDNYSVHIAGKPALLRAFVTLQGKASQDGVTARLTRYVGDVAMDSLDAGPITIYDDTNPAEGQLLQTLNFQLPAPWRTPGTNYVLQLDPGNAITENNETNNRYPATGVNSFKFVDTPALEVVIVPVTYARPGAPVTMPQVNDLAYLSWMPNQVYPVAQINYNVRSTPYTFTGDLRDSSGWSQLLNDITTIHEYEDPDQSKVYYGLVDSVTADACGNFCTIGLGWLNSPNTPLQKTAVGIAAFPAEPEIVSSTLTHEIGHVYGRKHAPCGFVTSVPDQNYPYGEGAPIGQWGYDSETGQLLSPTTYTDYMGYCDQQWTSDYTYYGIYQAFQWAEGWATELPNPIYLPAIMKGSPTLGLAANTNNQILTLRGVIAPNGSLHVDPLFRGPGSPAPSAADSRYQVVLLDAAGRQLTSQPLALTTIAFEQIESGEIGSGFRVSLPQVEGLASLQIYEDGELVFERHRTGEAPALGAIARSEGAGGEVQMSWSAGETDRELAYRLLFSPDGGANWQVLASKTAQPSVVVPPALLEGADHPLLQVQVSDGVQIAVTTISITELANSEPDSTR